MASFKVLFKPSVQRDLRSIPGDQVERILARAEQLAADPLPRGSVKLEGTDDLYRIRIGQYRMIYSVDLDASELLIRYVRHRREAYRR
jgi:mRNA interferase RelE/StbE